MSSNPDIRGHVGKISEQHYLYCCSPTQGTAFEFLIKFYEAMILDLKLHEQFKSIGDVDLGDEQ